MGLGPMVYGVVILIIELCGVEILCTGLEIFKAIFSTSVMAFLISGVSVVWQNEKLGLGLASLIHGGTLYLCYLTVYLLNDWLSKQLLTIIFFTIIFVVTYLAIWLIVYIIQSKMAKKLNSKL